MSLYEHHGLGFGEAGGMMSALRGQEYEPITLNPNHLPRPRYHKRVVSVYEPNTHGKQPACHSEFEVKNESLSGPPFLRLSTSKTRLHHVLPVTCLWEPMADSPVPELSLPNFLDCRCRYCKAYLNPGFEYISIDRKFRCNICGNVQEYEGVETFPVIEEGTYEVIAPKGFSLGVECGDAVVFLIDKRDVSVLETIITSIESGMRLSREHGSTFQVCILAFDSAICYYTRNAINGRIQEYRTIEAYWTPLPCASFFFHLQEEIDSIEAVFSAISASSQGQGKAISVFVALEAGKDLVKSMGGGKLIVFSPGKTENLDRFPSTQNWTHFGVSLNLFVINPVSDWSAMKKVSEIVSITGGRTVYCPDATKSSVTFLSTELVELLQPPWRQHALAKLRCSESISLVKVTGPGLVTGSTIHLPYLDSNTSIEFNFEVTKAV